MSETAKDPALFARSALEDCTVPEREELFALVRADPGLFELQRRIVSEDYDAPEPS